MVLCVSGPISTHPMPQSDFPSRAPSSGRPKLFLGDIEYAKKEEWERRRKLRLKQVRQQARDIATIIRNQSSRTKKKMVELNKCAQYESAVKANEIRKTELQQKIGECLTSVGTAHSSAALITEVDELLQHKIELQDTLARIRGELAAEKAKDTRKPRQEVVECPRERITISKMKSVKPALQKPNVRKMSPPKIQPNVSMPAPPPNLLESADGSSGDLNDGEVRLPTEKTIFSPPSLIRKRNKKPDGSPGNGRKSCPPRTESVDSLDSSPDSDDSGQTWPPVSVRKKKLNKVRMYDHSAKKCTEYVQQRGVIRVDKPSPSNMTNLIHEEEELVSKKTEDELERRKIEHKRGVKALRQEIAKQDFDAAIRELCLGSKKNRFRKAHNYQPPVDCDPNRTNLPLDEASAVNSQDRECDAREGQSLSKPSQHRPPAPASTEPLQTIISKFVGQREAILRGEPVQVEESSCGSDSEDSVDDLPLWIKVGQNAPKDVPDRVATPETEMARGSSASTKLSPANKSTNNISSDLSSFIRHEEEFEKAESPKDKNSSITSKSASQGAGSSSNDSSQSKSAGINVQIQIRSKSPVGRTSFRTPPKGSGSSTSYYSPPEKLSPQQISVLSDILSKMSVKNRNPVLHHYITRVLEMSHQSVSDLDVSVCSDFTIQSDLFPNGKEPRGGACGGLQKSAKSRMCVRELDAVSTAGTVCSSPRADSFSVASTPNHTGKIAALLRNIIELQRVYNSHALSDPSLAVSSEGDSSYRSVPRGMDVERFRDVVPSTGNVLNYCEDTGIFENRRDTSNGEEQPTLSSLLNGKYKKFPAHLLPNPFADDRKEDHDDRNPAFPQFMPPDVPDGYSQKPGVDPGSYLPRRYDNRVFNSLSDIESVVSSIQNTPTKRSSSPSNSRSSSASAITSKDFISSRELQNNDLINTTSSSDLEDVFRSLGLGWALSTLRRTRTSKNLRAEDSSSKSGSFPSSEETKSPGYHHSTPMKSSNNEKTSPEREPAVPSLTPPNITLQCPNWQK